MTLFLSDIPLDIGPRAIGRTGRLMGGLCLIGFCLLVIC